MRSSNGITSSQTVIYILEHPSRRETEKNLVDFQADSEWQTVKAKSEQNGKLADHIDCYFMEPTAFQRYNEAEVIKARQKGSSMARRPVAPPPLSQHLREFASNPHAWAVLARNLIPVVGIYGFGWSAGLTVFNYWFDGLAALAAILAALVPRALRETQKKSESQLLVMKIVRGVVTWIFLIGIVGLPYWMVLIPLHPLMFSDEVRRQLAHSAGLWATFGSLAAGHFWKAFRLGYDEMPDQQLKQRVRWDVYLLMLRAIAMFMMAAPGLYFILVPLMALLLSYFEIWPERVIGAVFGDPSRLSEYDPEHKQSDG